ncbi:MAG: AbrB/MazE/SpoVT family DNA-binding domain-containing protein [Cyanobacteria bacterium J06641_5]
MEIKLRQIGNSVGATFPKEALDRLGLKEGDRLTLSIADGEMRISAYDPNFEKAMAAYEKTSARYRNAMRELADG